MHGETIKFVCCHYLEDRNVLPVFTLHGKTLH